MRRVSVEWTGQDITRFTWDMTAVMMSFGTIAGQWGGKIEHIELSTQRVNTRALRGGSTREYGDVKRR